MNPNLASRINTLPLILCGPLLRRVTPDSVTVWVALRKKCLVRLTVHDSDEEDRNHEDHLFMNESRLTVQLGTHLHVVAVTARAVGLRILEPGVVYYYDLEFNFPAFSEPSQDFMQALKKPFDPMPEHNPLAYHPTTKLPSFALPPPSPQDLRIAHGSCRKPHGEGDDALPLLDALIETSVDLPFERPHQLLLTGDQIYSDEVAEVLLPHITDAAAVLLGYEEELPEPEQPGVTFKAKDAVPVHRIYRSKYAGLTSGLSRCHLFSFGEWMAMYLYVWSDTVWPDDVLSWDELYASLANEIMGQSHAAEWKTDIEKHRKLVRAFKLRLPEVRRILANVPIYMMFDDHDVTDDWNLTKGFCEWVYGNPLGQRLIQNGLVAYAVCQQWGNTPEQFEDASPPPAGKKLLDLLSSETQTYVQVSPQLFTLVGLHTAAQLAAQSTYRVYHEPGPTVTVHGVTVSQTCLDYAFIYEGAGHLIIFTDTRTCRRFPGGNISHPDLIDPALMSSQIRGNATDKIVIVVVSTNMPPIPSIRKAEKMLGSSEPKVYEYDLVDSWSLPTSIFDRMIAQISDLFPSANGLHSGRVVLLSGDVHSSFASRLMYWATSRYIDPPATPHRAKVAFAQLVSSALKNEDEKTRGQHADGYKYVPLWLAKLVVPGSGPTYTVGWNVREVTTIGSVTSTAPDQPSSVTKPYQVDYTRPSRTADDLEFAMTGGRFKTFALSINPDYRYRLDNIWANDRGQHPADPPVMEPITIGNAPARLHALLQFRTAAMAFRDYSKTVKNAHAIVGRNNISEISFTWDDGDNKAVHHAVRWRENLTTTVKWVRYSVSLSLTDSAYPPLGPGATIP